MNTKSSAMSYSQRSLSVLRRRLREQRARRGVTLVEVLIVVAIIAMVAGGVAVFALPKYKEAQIKNAETGARIVRTAIQQWQAANNETSCPTMSQLVQKSSWTLPEHQRLLESRLHADLHRRRSDHLVQRPRQEEGHQGRHHVPKGAGTPTKPRDPWGSQAMTLPRAHRKPRSTLRGVKMRADQRGLTLVELLIVIALIAVLGGTVLMGPGLLEGSRLKSAATLIVSGVRLGWPGRAPPAARRVSPSTSTTAS